MTTAIAATITAYVGKCPRCKGGVAATPDEAREAGYQLRSACCGRWTVLTGVKGKTSTRECGAHCEDATTTSCSCQCGGVRHGFTHRIK